jgi:hypothetical protein
MESREKKKACLGIQSELREKPVNRFLLHRLRAAIMEEKVQNKAESKRRV